MKRLILIVLALAVLLSLACYKPNYTWKVVSWFPGDEQLYYQVCYLDHGKCSSYQATATVINEPGTCKQAPPTGAMCIDLGNGVLDCGYKYLHLYVLPVPN
jgi:hypothetical protein